MPNPAGILAPLLLAGVLLLSAVAKWKEPVSTQSAITLLRLPRFLQNQAVAKALPIGEGVLALAMLAPWSPVVKVASVLAAALFLAYAVIVGRALTFDPRPSCGCFGRIGDQRIIPRTLVRNLFLVAAAGVFLWFAFAGHTVPATLTGLGDVGWAWILMAALVAVVAVLVLGSSAGGPSRAPAPRATSDVASSTDSGVDAGAEEEDYIRTPIPQGLLLDPEGAPHLLTEIALQRAQLLVFVNCYCGSTHLALRSAREWRERLPQIDVRTVFSGVPVMPSTDDLDTTDSWVDHGSLAWRKFDLHQSPSAVLLGADGLLAGGPVAGNEELDAFLEEIAEALAEAPVGQPETITSETVPAESEASRQEEIESAHTH